MPKVSASKSLSKKKVLLFFTFFCCAISLIVSVGLDLSSYIGFPEIRVSLSQHVLTNIYFSFFLALPYIAILIICKFIKNINVIIAGVSLALVFGMPVTFYIAAGLIIDNLRYQTPDAGFASIGFIIYGWSAVFTGFLIGIITSGIISTIKR